MKEEKLLKVVFAYIFYPCVCVCVGCGTDKAEEDEECTCWECLKKASLTFEE